MDFSNLIEDITGNAKADKAKNLSYEDKIYKEFTDNIMKSQAMRIQINKYQGNNINELAEMLLECITEMTSDTVFYQQNIKKIKTLD